MLLFIPSLQACFISLKETKRFSETATRTSSRIHRGSMAIERQGLKLPDKNKTNIKTHKSKICLFLFSWFTWCSSSPFKLSFLFAGLRHYLLCSWALTHPAEENMLSFLYPLSWREKDILMLCKKIDLNKKWIFFHFTRLFFFHFSRKVSMELTRSCYRPSSALQTKAVLIASLNFSIIYWSLSRNRAWEQNCMFQID